MEKLLRLNYYLLEFNNSKGTSKSAGGRKKAQCKKSLRHKTQQPLNEDKFEYIKLKIFVWFIKQTKRINNSEKHLQQRLIYFLKNAKNL